MQLMVIFVFILTGIGLGLLQPIIWAKILNGMFMKDFNIITTSAIYMMLLYLLQESANFLRLHFHTYLSNNLVNDIKRDMYQSILSLPIKAFAEINDNYYSNIAQTLSGIKEVRSLMLKDEKHKEFLSLSNLLKSKNIHINILNNMSESLSHSVSFTMNIAIIRKWFYTRFLRRKQ
ncbi:MAG: ABC transporter transmembrane domain-containing protein [Caulobacteraceae bacterium]